MWNRFSKAYKANKIVKFVFQGFVGRRTSFEVKVNGTMVHSKLTTMAFPDFPEVVSIVQVSAP